MVKKALARFLKKTYLSSKATIVRKIFQGKTIDPLGNILLTSEPRSGSTWLMQVLSKGTRFPSIWEPFDLNKGVLPNNLGLGWFPYVDENQPHPELKHGLGKLFSGDNLGYYAVSHSSLSEYYQNHSFVIKFVRANLLLPWMTQNFDLHYKPIHLIRHPIPTVLSQIFHFHQNRKNWRFNPKYPPYRKHIDFLNELKTPFEYQVGKWAVHNECLLNRNMGDWVTVYYENLLLDPMTQLNELAQESGFSLKYLDEKILRRPSKSNYKGQFENDVQIQLSKWTSKVTSDQISRAQEILDYFDIHQYRAESPMPNIQNRV